ncbi:NRDE protein-domain-containing protein [Mycena capillaripes]|nr:NRDE protein-domain-containing protein [Mycena capillaripes]
MCVAFWTLDHPDYALILCANRDEYLARPALAAAFHAFGTHSKSDSASNDPQARVLSGRDSQSGGTWLGFVPSTGRVALLTNITEPLQSLPSSRGDLSPAFLLAAPHTPLDVLYPPDAQYAGFNLLLLEAEWQLSPPPATSTSRCLHFPHASLVSNGGAGGPLTSRPLRPDERATGGLSNGLHVGGAGGEAWPKVVQGRALFEDAVKVHTADGAGEKDADAALAGRLFALLRTTAAEPVRVREELRNTICVSPLEIHTKPSAAASAPGDTSAGANSAVPAGPAPNADKPAPKYYATRTASVLVVRRSGEGLFVERDVWRLADGGVELYEGGAIGGMTGGAGAVGEDAGERVFHVQLGGGDARLS